MHTRPELGTALIESYESKKRTILIGQSFYNSWYSGTLSDPPQLSIINAVNAALYKAP